MERPRTIPCPEDRGECKYAPNCHLSLHHLVKRSYVKEKISERPEDEYFATLAKRYSNHPTMQVMACRMIHDLLDMYPSQPLPPEEKMLQVIGGHDAPLW